MDSNNILSGLVDTLSQQILKEVSAKVDASLGDIINQQLSAINVASRVDAAARSEAKVAAAQYQPNLNAIDKQLAASTKAIIDNISVTAQRLVNEVITTKINSIDFDGAIASALASVIDHRLKEFDFPENSIKSTAIEQIGTISGDTIRGGIIREFGSTGIDDRATDCRVTIMDDVTVVENNLLTKDLTVKGDTVFEGNLSLNGTIVETSPGFITVVNAATEQLQQNLNDELFMKFSRHLYTEIHQHGLDLSHIKLNGKDLVTDNRLGDAILESKLQKVGVLQDLMVRGETLLHNTLYTASNRVGINTMEPNSALSIWDEEIDLNIGKLQKGVAQISSNRDQLLVIGTNGKKNLVLNTDGSVTMPKLQLGTTSISTAGSPPSSDAEKGSIVFNSNPSVGGPMGWVSLGQARWANFGIIE
jgi:hypothetical protein